MVSYLLKKELTMFIKNFDLDTCDIYDLIDYYTPSNSIHRHKEESLYEFASRMQGSNDTLSGIIRDMIAKGNGQQLTRKFPLLMSWIEEEVSKELDNGYKYLSDRNTPEQFEKIWNPELESYGIVLFVLEKFISFDINKQQKIAGVI